MSKKNRFSSALESRLLAPQHFVPPQRKNTENVDSVLPVKKFALNIGGIKSNQILATLDMFQRNCKAKFSAESIDDFGKLTQKMLSLVDTDEKTYKSHQGESIAVCILFFVLCKLGIDPQSF
jgi:hypothetical protein